MPSFRFASATGSGSSLIVTCSDQFAGKTITCTNGTKTYTRTCPSTSPYEVVFKGVAPGTWTVSGVVEGSTYSQQVVITDFDVILTAGVDYKQWVTLGGLDPTDYASLSEVFADEVAVRRLMTIHASADYLIEKVTDDVDAIDDFTANDTAMKWIGLRDYVCDGLTAITGVEAKLLASTYWERYLKDHVPTMTGNSSPYGTASAYQVFDGSTSTTASGTDFSYKFTNPICVKKFECNVNDGTLQGSNDGSTWTTISTPESNTTYYLYYRVHFTSSKTPHTIQFYGRSLDVSVPVMTSNTAPYGTVNVSSQGTGYEGFRAFNDTSSFWQGQSPTNQWLSYGFINASVIKKFSLKANNSGSVVRVKNFKLQASNVANFSDRVDLGVYVQSQNNNVQVFECNNNTPYKYYRIFVLDTYGSSNYISIDRLQFYGLDYSEREFAEGSTMKYLYDHGVELVDFDFSYVSHGTAQNDGDKLKITCEAGYGYGAHCYTNEKINLTNYNSVWTRGNAYENCAVSNGSYSVIKITNTKQLATAGAGTESVVIGSQVREYPYPYTYCFDASSINEECYIDVNGVYYYSNIITKYETEEAWLE